MERERVRGWTASDKIAEQQERRPWDVHGRIGVRDQIRVIGGWAVWRFMLFTECARQDEHSGGGFSCIKQPALSSVT